MIPIRDDTPATRPPVVTWTLIAICAFVYLLQVTAAGGQGEGLVMDFAMVPARVFADELPLPVEQHYYDRFGVPRVERVLLHGAAVPEWLTLLTCTFLHGGLLHVLGNLWILWIFGDNVEDRLGRLPYLGFYLGCGVAASAAHLLSAPDSPVPTVGASGAIAGVMGAYFLLYPRARVLALLPLGFFLYLATVPAAVFLGLWFLLQVLSGAAAGGGGVGGVAWWAHIGGFVVGLGVAALLRSLDLLRPPPVQSALSARRLHLRRRPPPW